MMKIKGAITGAAMLSLAAIVLVSSAAITFAANIADLSWDQSNLSKLHSFDKDDIFDFLVQTKDAVNDEAIELYLGDDSRCVEGFTWANLAVDRRYDLVVVFEPEGTSLTNIAAIYRRGPSGKIGVETIDGDGIALNGNRGLETPKLIQDLDGDGKYELVVPQEWGSTRATSAVISLKVYRLSNGSYIEASRDFPKFYDTQVLPGLEDEINQAKHEPLRNGPAPPGWGMAMVGGGRLAKGRTGAIGTVRAAAASPTAQ
jgi:hypothetical protein